MPTNLTNESISSTYTQLLHVNGGVTGPLVTIHSGNGVASACAISTTGFRAGNVILSSNTISTSGFNDLNLTPGGSNTVNIANVNITGGTIDGVSAITDVGTISVEGGAYTKVESASSSSGTLTLDCDTSNVFTVTLTENVSSFVLNNIGSGQTVNVLLTQDGTGSRTMSWPASFKWPSGSAPSLSTGAGEVDLLTATRIGSSWYATLIKDFS